MDNPIFVSGYGYTGTGYKPILHHNKKKNHRKKLDFLYNIFSLFLFLSLFVSCIISLFFKKLLVLSGQNNKKKQKNSSWFIRYFHSHPLTCPLGYCLVFDLMTSEEIFFYFFMNFPIFLVCFFFLLNG